MLGMDVLTAARQRVALVFDRFERIYVSFSGGKDSSVMLHLVMDEAKRRGRKVGILFVDLEGQYKLTIDHILECKGLYSDMATFHWVALPLALRNAVSVFEPKWCCWEASQKERWVRTPPEDAITEANHSFPWFKAGMEFEEFVELFGEWYAEGQPTACFVGIRTVESLNRWRTIASHTKESLEGHGWTTRVSPNVFNCYPIYDWRTEDIWVYNGKAKRPYNRLYDRMHQAGLSMSQQRICQPYGDDQRKGLWLFHIIEPETWARIVARVAGANQGALYAQESGNALGRLKITKPEGHTWQSFARLLLATMPPPMRTHYEDKITVFVKWWQKRGYDQGIPDQLPPRLESGTDGKRGPSWRRICKALLRNDYWCKGLSFTQTSSDKEAIARYRRVMDRRRTEWGISL